jgi:uncharacterized protein YoxC
MQPTEIPIPNGKIGNVLATLTSAFSLVATVVYVTWQVASIEQRLALAEQRSADIQMEIDQGKTQETQTTSQFQNQIFNQISYLNTKVDKITTYLMGDKKDV